MARRLIALLLLAAPLLARAQNSTPEPFGKSFSTTLAANVSLDMVWIEPGTFKMGAFGAENGNYPSDGPQTTVTLTKGFWLGKFEVTQAQWEAVMGTNVEEIRQDNLARRQAVNAYFPAHGVGPDLPMYYVTWDDAMNFCAKLTQAERAAGRLPPGYEYSLPTSAQWEYAARAGTTSRFYNGDTDEDYAKIAWFSDTPVRGDQPAPPIPMHPVGQKAPNAWGLYDMLGNVAEWCYDIYHSNGGYPGGSITDYVDHVDNPFKGYVMRGGSIYDNPKYARITAQYSGGYSYTEGITGFRVALTQVPRPPSVVTATYLAPLPLSPASFATQDAKASARAVLALIQAARQETALADPGTHAALLTDFNVLESMANTLLSDNGKDATATTALLADFDSTVDDTLARAVKIDAGPEESSSTRNQAHSLAEKLRQIQKM